MRDGWWLGGEGSVFGALNSDYGVMSAVFCYAFKSVYPGFSISFKSTGKAQAKHQQGLRRSPAPGVSMVPTGSRSLLIIVGLSKFFCLKIQLYTSETNIRKKIKEILRK